MCFNIYIFFKGHFLFWVFSKQSIKCCGSHSPRDVTSMISDLEGLGERRFRTALEIWAPSHAGSLEMASANWTLSCQDTSDRATATPELGGGGMVWRSRCHCCRVLGVLCYSGERAGQQSCGPRSGGCVELGSPGAQQPGPKRGLFWAVW